MSEEIIIRYCAPTLAGLKAGNLFSYKYSSACSLLETVKEHNILLNKKGVYLVILKAQAGTALIFVYRKKLLEHILEKDEVRKFLKRCGYTQFNISSCLNKLKEHLLFCEFPHEIGIFLGYPLEDVKGFIEHKGANSKCIGCWKVYTNEEDARKTFTKFKRCTDIYRKKFMQGIDITRLTIAG